MSLGKAIRICRAANGVSQKRLARDLHISGSYLCLVEAGKRQLRPELLVRVSEVLEVPMPLIALLASSPADLSDRTRSIEIGRMARSLLWVLVSAGLPDHEKPRLSRRQFLCHSTRLTDHRFGIR